MNIGMAYKKIINNNEPLTEIDYQKSRTYSIFEGSFARTIFNLTSGAFLAGFAGYLGAGDSFNGIIAAIPVLAGVIQLFSPIVFEKMEKRKHIVMLLCLIHRLLLGFMVFIPFIVKGQSARLAMVAAVYFISYLAVSFINPAASGWIIDLTPENIRGKYFGTRESYMLGAATVFTLIMGRVLDIYKDKGNEYGGFIVMFSFVIVLAVGNFVSFSLMKEKPVKINKTGLNLSKVITIPLKDKKFRKIVMLFIFWNIAVQIGGPFFAIYMVTGLKLSYTYIMAVVMIGTLTNTLLVRIWGRMADRKSWVFVIKLSILMLAFTHFVWLFINPSTSLIMVPLMNIAGGAAWAGIGISAFNIQFIYSPEEGRTVYIGFNAAFSGLIGFLSTLAGSALLLLLGGFKISISGFTIGSMQVVFAISGILLAACAAYIHAYIHPEVT